MSMRIYTLQCEMLAKTSPEETFKVFEDPYNLAKITPPWLNFQIVAEDRLEMRKNLRIDYRIKWLVLSMRWRSVIVEYEPPRRFVDQQEKGPYAFWRHQHTFESGKNGVKVGDKVEYALPFGVLGQLAHAAVVERQLLEIFRYRQQKLAQLLGGKAQEISAPRVS